MGVAAALFAFPALAQVGSTGSSAAGGVGSSSSVGGSSSGIGSSSIGGSGISGGGSSGIGSSGSSIGSSASGVGSTVTDPIIPDTGLGSRGGADANAARATEGDSSINSLNVDGLARSGIGGSAATTTLGDDDGFQSTAGAGSPQAYRIPTPTVDVDLGAIRRGMAAGPSATPKPNGD
ncbi:hypothetical protein [Aurantimonas aggregata]|nr:hypothetical protein [Aurantimonas aggregata]